MLRRSSERRKFAGGTVALALMLGAGAACGEDKPPPPPVRIGVAPSNPAKITVPNPVSNGIVPGSQWPDPCGLVTDSELRAVLPQATQIAHTPRSRTFRLRDPRMNFAGQITVPRQRCEIKFELPHDPKYAAQTALLEISLDMVGSRRVAWLNYKRPTSGENVDECTRGFPSEVQCRKGRMVFTMRGNTAFGSRFEGQQGTGQEAARQIYLTKVMPEFRKLILAKIP